MGFLITVLITVPLVALGTWLYLRRRDLSPRLRIVLLLALFLVVLVSGPALIWMWARGGVNKDLASTGRAGGLILQQIPIAWLIAVGLIGTQLFRLWRRRGEL